MSLFAILIAGIAGLAVAFQAKILSDLDLKIGPLGNMLVNFLFGSIAVFFILVITSWMRNKNPFAIFFTFNLSKIPLWQLSSGLTGIIIVTSIGWSASKIGISNTLITVFFFQILIGALIDHFGWLGSQSYPFNWMKLVSLSLIFLGTYLFFKS